MRTILLQVSITLFLIGLFSLAFSQPANAEISRVMNFQTKILNRTDKTNLDATSTPCLVAGPSNDTCDFRVRIWNLSSGGTATPGNNLMFEELHQNIEIGNFAGILNLSINSVCQATINTDHNWSVTAASSTVCSIIDDNDAGSIVGVNFNRSDLWVEISFDPSGTWSDLASPPVGIETFQRFRLTSAPSAQMAETLSGYSASDFVQFAWSNSGQTTDKVQSLVNLSTSSNNTNPLLVVNEDGAGTPDLLDMQVASNSVFNVNNFGTLTLAGDVLTSLTPEQEVNWVKTSIGTNGSVVANAQAVASDGSVYTVGNFSSSADFGNGVNMVASSNDYFIVKHDSAGNFQWVRREIGGAGAAIAQGVAVASDGSVYVVGQFSSSAVDFGSGLLTPSSTDYFLVKFDSAGNFQWVRREIGGTGSAVAYGVTVASDGSVYTAGLFQTSSVDFGSGLLTPSSTDHFLVKFDSAGSLQWVRREIGGTGSAQARGVAVASDGSVYTAGYFSGTVDFGSGSLVASSNDYFLIKHDSAGNFQWVRREVGGTGSAIAQGVAVASDGSIYTVGNFSSTVDFGSGSLVASGSDYFLVKFDNAGNFQWVRREVGGTGSAIAQGVAVASSDGSVYTAGYFQSSSVDFGSGLLTPSGTDYFLVKFDSAGNFQWVRREVGGTGSAQANGVAVASDGSVYTAGLFQTASVDFGSGLLTPSGVDYFLVKFDSAGNFQWVRREPPPLTGAAIAEGVAVASDGSVYTAGYFQSSSVDFGSGLLTPSGFDYFLVKHDSAGNFQWVRREVGGSGSVVARGVAVGSDGSVYTVGNFNGTVDFGGGSLVASGNDYFLVKFDSAGNFQWVRREVGGTGDAIAQGVAVASDGSVYVAGQFSTAAVDFGSGSLTPSITDYFLVKHDSGGNFQWVRREVVGATAVANGVAVASDGSVYTAGYFSGTVDFGSGSLVSSSNDYFIVKHDSAGNFQWVRREVGGTGNAQAHGVAVASDGSVYVAGSFQSSSVDFGSGLLTPSGLDYFLVKHDSAGNFQWVRREVGGTANALATGVAAAPNGDIYISGLFYSGTMDFGGGLISKSGSGFMYLAKFNSYGDFKWVKYPDSGTSSYAEGIAVDGSSVYFTGYFSSIVDFFGFVTMNASPSTRYFTMKLGQDYSGSNIGTSTARFRAIFVQNVRADKLYFGNSYLNFSDSAFNYMVDEDRVFEINSQGDIRIQTNGNKNIVNTAGTNLVQITDLSQNFGAYVETGAMISRNSYLGEEFMRKRANITANTYNGWGDTAFWTVNEQAAGTNDCTFSIVDNAVNGISRMQNVQANTGCITYHGRAAGTLQRIFNAANLPLMYFKVRPSAASANDNTLVGITDQILFTAAEPTNGVYFTNNSGTDWAGVTRNGGVSTTVACTGQTISTTQYALLKVETRSTTDVRFYVDTDVSNGVQWFYCGSSSTNVPTTNLAATIRWRSTTANQFLDTDYYRIWQDDAATVSDNIETTQEAIVQDPTSYTVDFEVKTEQQYPTSYTQEDQENFAPISYPDEALTEEQKLINQISLVTGLKFTNLTDANEIRINTLRPNDQISLEIQELEILGNLFVEGTLKIYGDLEVSGNTKIYGELKLSSETAGNGILPAEAQEIRVNFNKAMPSIPTVLILIDNEVLQQDFTGYTIESIDETGFTLKFFDIPNQDIKFQWLAIQR